METADDVDMELIISDANTHMDMPLRIHRATTWKPNHLQNKNDYFVAAQK